MADGAKMAAIDDAGSVYRTTNHTRSVSDVSALVQQYGSSGRSSATHAHDDSSDEDMSDIEEEIEVDSTNEVINPNDGTRQSTATTNLFGSLRDAVTTSVRMAMESRLTVRREQKRIFESLQKSVGQTAMLQRALANTVDSSSRQGQSFANVTVQSVFETKNFRQCLQHPNLKPLAILEVKRLWCALMFLIEEKNVRMSNRSTSLQG